AEISSAKALRVNISCVGVRGEGQLRPGFRELHPGLGYAVLRTPDTAHGRTLELVGRHHLAPDAALGIRGGRPRTPPLRGELAESGPQALAGLAGLLLLLSLVLLEALNRCQKPRRLWLAIDHGAAPFGRHAAGGCWTRGASRGVRADGWTPAAPRPIRP